MQFFAVGWLLLFLKRYTSADIPCNNRPSHKEEIMTKTITLSGTEQVLSGIGGTYACLYNGGAGTVYASPKGGITAGADGVTPVPAGGSAIVECNGTVYLLGTGSVTAVGSSEPISFFKTAPISGGGNMADNPDFTINQWGYDTYDGNNNYCVDRWKRASGVFDATPLSGGGIRLVNRSVPSSNYSALQQTIAIKPALWGKPVTLSASLTETHGYAYMNIYALNSDKTVIGTAAKTAIHSTGMHTLTWNNIPANTAYLQIQFICNSGLPKGTPFTVEWVKLEEGGTATSFTRPNAALELLKCQVYLQIVSGEAVDFIDLRPTMADVIDIIQINGGFAYVAE